MCSYQEMCNVKWTGLNKCKHNVYEYLSTEFPSDETGC